MSDNLKNLYGGKLLAAWVTLYTTPVLTKTILKEIVLCNPNETDATVNIMIGGIYIIGGKKIAAKDTFVVELHSVLEPGKTITGIGSIANAIDIYISGIEVT